MSSHKEFISFIEELARASGEIIVPYFASDVIEVFRKTDQSPVTAADRESELVMRDLIRQRYPTHGILGEEFGHENKGAEWTWVLDPIDGTISFTHQCPLFGTLIGLLHQDRPVLGAIHQPVLKELCIGDGQMTTINGRVVEMRVPAQLSETTLLTTDISNIDRYQRSSGFKALAGQCKMVRTWGDCYGYLMLAAGRADIMIDPIMNAWDILPLVPIIEGAGGKITSWDGGDVVGKKSSVASHPKIHAQVIELLNRA